LSKDCHETSNSSGVGKVVGERKEYGIMLSVMQLALLFPLFSPTGVTALDTFEAGTCIVYRRERGTREERRRLKIGSSVFSLRTGHLYRLYMLVP